MDERIGRLSLGALVAVIAGCESGRLDSAGDEVASDLTAGNAMLIEAGGDRSYVDRFGRNWEADRDFEGGFTLDRGNIPISNSNIDRIYQTERGGRSGSHLPGANGRYTVRLHFAET